MKKIISFLLLLYFVCLWVEAQEKKNEPVQAITFNEEIFALLNLDYPGLEKVKDAYRHGNVEDASRFLLEYYRMRKEVVNPAINLKKISVSKTDQQWADDALKHTVLVTDPPVIRD